MPQKFVNPEVFLRYRGVKVFHVYRNDNFNDKRSYIYGNSIDCTDDGEDAFDVRDLPVPEGINKNDHVAIIKAAIDAGNLEFIGEQVVLDKDEKVSYAAFGYILERGFSGFPMVVMTKDELMALVKARNKPAKPKDGSHCC